MLKKFLSVSVVVATLASFAHAEEKSGVLVGISAGLGIVNTKLGQEAGQYHNTSATFALGARVGYNLWLNSFLGFRGYVEYDFSGISQFSQAAAPYGGVGLHDITANIDVLFNFISTSAMNLGVFVGIGAGYSIYQVTGNILYITQIDSYNYNGFILPINVGLSLGLGQRQRIELSAKIPTTIAVATMQNLNGLSVRDNLILLTYQFTF